MFESINDDARQTLLTAAEHARALWHGHIGVEHLLLALVDHARGPVTEALFTANLSPRDIWTQARRLVGDAIDGPPEHLPYSPGVKHVLHLAMTESRRLGHHHIGAEHLLLGILGRLDDPWAGPEVAGEILQALGAEVGLLRQDLTARLPS
ncbi:hypothetical protein KIH27_08685 [Mycobacterium sp. M1]|uniref:Clp R domain-containing protein n=1 Tax=Mycolicibacter acidiphilus TaxID=2835306 RepID=A0ABS5RL44_9MYCO|nr:Clp protease N-terminal domain-containing protein [Mycolicibacter acidiphilus]MBS9533659.1 hypothetical protein [Mycolicibacter acidiphilus]